MNARSVLARILLVGAAALALFAPTGAPVGAAPRSQTSTFDCSFHPLTQSLLDETRQADWVGWVARLTGAQPVVMGENAYTFTTRSSFALFNGQENALAYPYLLQTLQQWYPPTQIEEDPYEVLLSGQRRTWKNLILEIPGQATPQEIVILTAHLDSTSPTANTLAPGADDNAGGAAALLEAARLLRSRFFQRTIRLIWFTGEEQGMLGSRDYVRTHDLSGVMGVINLDMFSYDSDGDHCLELQVGVLPQSDAVGRCFTQAITAYQLNLTADYFNNSFAVSASDHSSFWQSGIGAIAVGQNIRSLSTPGGCVGADQNPNYHKVTDTLENIHPAYGFATAQAALAAISDMAEPLPEPLRRRLFLPVISDVCVTSLDC